MAVFVGFGILSLADPMGRNWAAALSPFLILGGYLIVVLGIFWPADKTPPPPPVKNP